MAFKIYTKTGDKGSTSIYGGKKVSKNSIKLEAYGNIDELNSWVGLLGDYTINNERSPFLRKIQADLFVLGTHLASDPEKKGLKLPNLPVDRIVEMEDTIDQYQSELPELKSFILPGGHKEVSFCHIARTVCRRAERSVVALAETENVNPNILSYLNRLSDFLFVLARLMAKDLKAEEIKWLSDA